MEELNRQLLERIEKLEAIIEAQAKHIEIQAKHIEVQAKRIAELEAKLARNSKNSHTPPSHDGPKSRSERKRRKPSTKPRGGQKGHEGHHRQLLEASEVSAIFDCKPCQCEHCGEGFDSEDPSPRRHQVTEIPPIVPVITEYRVHKLRCTSCGKKTHGKLPEGVVGWSSFGPRVHAIVGTLRGEGRLSLSRVQALLKDMFGITISRASLSAMDARHGQQLTPFHDEIGTHLRAQEMLHVDETSWYLKGNRMLLWVMTHPVASYFKIMDSRSQKAAKEVIGEDFQGYLITDRYSAYLSDRL